MRIRLIQSAVLALALLGFGAVSQVYAADGSEMVTCKDGTTSKAGKGACSHHGGKQKAGAATASQSSAASTESAPTTTPVKKKMKAAASSTGTSTASASADSAGAATAKCKDGTMSHAKNHKGACSHHGGVAEWMDK